ncbi:MAG: hypothetical protein A2744_01370 [Candidatus Buchananbacteria bacterium RIFCSPHIGHO2_01_FULL_44_11]|uniref:Nucleotide-diphospho-sugar transferase domain-containing protein n=1 Tax=Candidatus Buchananbacteria bacterium RIFCSPHIGHO2_01_FULL_44_11 TaxID=1797535 RepID=A0A1G1Y0V4_9BACT|nr:MAG: hypothetical protein A2744_01370 [Candidatus Buchananbacteria bacterium RIFCSPHIGHO2_01_FULL_44_11]
MNFKDIKLEFFHFRKAFLQYHQGWQYIYNKFILAKKIYRLNRVFGEEITHQNLSIHTMLGHKHVVMGLWSLCSFYIAANFSGKLYIHSDGTLTNNDQKILSKFFPQSELVDPGQVLSKYAAEYDQYPPIKKFRLEHKDNFFQTKLIDPYIISTKDIRLFFDVDILWFKNPDLIQNEIENGCPHSLMMSQLFKSSDNPSDANTVYFKDGSKLPEKYSTYNGGIMLYSKNNFPAAKLINYLENLDMSRLESQHWVEQSGYAYNMQHLEYLPMENYPIKELVTDRVVARHYTGPRRAEFYIEGIPRIIKKLGI